MRARLAVAATLALLPVLLPGLAAGQAPQPTPPPAAETEVRTPPPPTIPSAPPIPVPGPTPTAERPRKLFEFHPGVTLSEEYSDNFNRTVDDEVENFRTTLAPGITLLLDSGFLTGRAAYTLAANYDSSSSSEDVSLFNSIAAGLNLQATPRLGLSASYAFKEGDQPGEVDRLGLRQERRRFTTHALSLGGGYSLANVDLRPYYRLSSFSEENRSENLAHTAGLTVSTVLLRSNTLSLGYERLWADAEQETSTAPSSESRTTGHRASGSFTRELTPRASAGVSGAYSTRTQERTNPSREIDFDQWTGSLFGSYVIPSTIALRATIGVSQLNGGGASGDPLVSTSSTLSYWLGRAVATLSVERGFSETFGDFENNGVVQTTGVSGSLSYEFTPSFSGKAGGSYRENERTGVGANEENTATDYVVGGSVSFAYQILRWLGSTLEYSYGRTTSTEPSRDGIIENRIKLALSATF